MKPIFWNTNTQNDFFGEGSMKVNNSSSIRPKLKALTEFAKENKIKVVNVISWNDPKNSWFSSTPDYVKTFPPHCIMNTDGTSFIPETLVDNDYFLVKWDSPYIVFPEIHKHRNILIFKNAMDMIEGNKFADSVMNNLGTILGYRPEYVVYGINALSVAKNLTVRGYDVRVVSDASIESSQQEIDYETINVKQVTSDQILSLQFE